MSVVSAAALAALSWLSWYQATGSFFNAVIIFGRVWRSERFAFQPSSEAARPVSMR